MKPINVFTVETRVDPMDPPGYQAGGRRLAPIIGGKEIGGGTEGFLVRRESGVDHYDGE